MKQQADCLINNFSSTHWLLDLKYERNKKRLPTKQNYRLSKCRQQSTVTPRLWAAEIQETATLKTLVKLKRIAAADAENGDGRTLATSLADRLVIGLTSGASVCGYEINLEATSNILEERLNMNVSNLLSPKQPISVEKFRVRLEKSRGCKQLFHFA